MAATVRGKIISLYRYRGRMTLHIEISGDALIKPGMTGSVLKEETEQALSNGQIQVVKVTGRFCIATTDLLKLGKNRWVLIRSR